MRPLNTADRKKSFYTFLIFYVISTSLIVLTVYFGMRVPFRQNARLKEQVALLEKEKDFAQRFSAKATTLKNQLDSVNRPGVQAPLVEGYIDENIKQLNQMVSSDSVAVKALYQDMIHLSLSLKDAKRDLRGAAGKDENLSQYLSQIESLKGELRDCKTSLQIMLMSQQRQN